jgi:glycosyltransferase involved in cell wall biosynthesis
LAGALPTSSARCLALRGVSFELGEHAPVRGHRGARPGGQEDVSMEVLPELGLDYVREVRSGHGHRAQDDISHGSDGSDAVLCVLDDARVMGGGQYFALRLARHISRSRGADRVLLACPGNSALAKAARQEAIEVADVAFPNPRLSQALQLVPALMSLRRLIASTRPATLVGNSARCQLYAFVAMMRLPAHPPLVAVLLEQDSARRRVLRMLYRRIGRLEALGSNAARAYRGRLRGVDVHQINNFLTDEEYEELGSLARPARRDPGQRVLGVLSRLIPEKGVVELVEELAVVGTDHWGKLLIAGPAEHPSYERRLRGRITELGLDRRIHLLGPVPDAGRFLPHVDVVIVPSTGNEGQPTVILEALAGGRPVIVRRSAYADDYNGLAVIPFDNARDLVRCLSSLPDPPRSDTLLRERFGAGQVLSAIERASTGDR